jgi:hypothetical protein
MVQSLSGPNILVGGPHKKPLFTQLYPSKGKDFNHINERRLVIDLCNNNIHIKNITICEF